MKNNLSRIKTKMMLDVNYLLPEEIALKNIANNIDTDNKLITTSDGDIFDVTEYVEAIKREIEWLNNDIE